MLILLISNIIPTFTYAEEMDNDAIINLFSNLLNTYWEDNSCEVWIEYTSWDYKWVTTENCWIKITEYNGTSTDIIIPEEMNWYQTKEIWEDVFKQKDITSVEIPDTVEIIWTWAFNLSNFSNNYIINLPSNLKRIEKQAFKTCNLSWFDKLPEWLIFIWDYAFSNYYDSYGFGSLATSNLNSIIDVIIPNTVEYIWKYAFAWNPMDKIIIWNSVKEIWDYAFQWHRQKDITTVTELSIPDSVEKIWMSAFYYNMHLDTVNIWSWNWMIKIMPYAFSSCWIKNFEINKDIIYLYSGGNSRWASYNPYENIKITANRIIRDSDYVLLWWSNWWIYANLILSWEAFSWLITQNWWWYGLYLKNITFPESITWLENRTNNYSLIQNFSWTLIIPWHIKSIWYNAFNGNSNLKNLIFEEWVEKIENEAFYVSNNIENIKFSSTIKSIWNKAFAYLNKVENLTIPWNIKKIWNNAFEWAIKLKNLNLWEWIEEIWEKAFFQISKDINWVYIPDSINIIWLNAFCRDTWDSVNKVYVIDESRITWYVTKDVPQEWIDNETCMNFIRRYKVDFTWDLSFIAIPERQVLDLNWNAVEPNIEKINGYEFLWWYEENSETPFDFNTPVTEDKTLYAHWKSLEEKAEETTTENVVYTNTTTVTVWNEVTEETLSWSSTLTLVSKEVEDKEVKKEEDTTKVQESEIRVTSDKTVEYEWWLEVYLEKTEDTWTEVKTGKVEWIIKFSAPVAVKIPVSSDVEYVKVQVKHGDEDFGFKWLTLNPVNECNNWEAVNDKYNWENVEVKNNNWDKYATIYTCSASTFVAYTESTKPAKNTTITSSSAAWWGRTNTYAKNEIKTVEQEHNSADIEKAEVEETTTKTTDAQTIQEQVNKIQWRSLTRWEVAIMTNILLEVYPQLVEWKAELDDVTNACSNYADEKNFTKDEKKAITRLCKLSIMWIHNDTNEPLEEFLVNNKTTNDEFSKVINRSIENYNEKDFSVVKDALKKLEWDEENVVFGTVYDVFMEIKNIFN